MRQPLFLFFFLTSLVSHIHAQIPAYPSFSWDNATVYFVMTDRFANGNTANDHSYGRGFDGAGNPYPDDASGHFFGGDLIGLTQKIDEGYFKNLGIDVIWLSAPFEQIHGWVGGGNGDTQYYAFHGYWLLDFTQLDANWGTPADMQTFVDTAHAHGIRVVLDVVMNHAGYATMTDMKTFGFGTLKSDDWETWRPGADETWHSFNDLFIDLTVNAEDWARWWGPGWVRAPIAGYSACGETDVEQCLAFLPDFKLESEQLVEIPIFLQEKWGPEELAQEQAELDAFFETTGYPQIPRYFLIKWLTDWVRAYGIDGFRVDTAKHVELDTWLALKKEAVRALDDWKNNHTGKKLDDLPFWMTGEVWGHGVERTTYFDYGFDSLINFSFQNVNNGVDLLDSLYTSYANLINGDAGFNVLSYISSHDTRLFGRDSLIEAGTRLLLAPGAVQVFYGDETARPKGPVISDIQQQSRSPMNWDAIDPNVLEHWQILGQFRHRHRAVGAGMHQRLVNTQYAFARSYKDADMEDHVIVVTGASGRTTLNVSRIFPDDLWLRDAYTGRSATVSYGIVTFNAHPNGVILIEEVK